MSGRFGSLVEGLQGCYRHIAPQLFCCCEEHDQLLNIVCDGGYKSEG